MNSLIEKEKKLNLALTKLKNLNLKNPDIKKDIENLNNQKNQLEIEKQELEEKYKSLINDYNDLTKKLDKFQNQFKDYNFYYLGAHENHFNRLLKNYNIKIGVFKSGII